MITFVLVQDPNLTAPPWWMVLLPKGDHDTLLRLHKVFTRQWWILDSRDPHSQKARDSAEKEGRLDLAHLRHPTVLSGRWMQTAVELFTRGDVLVSSKGGMRPRDRSLVELETRQGKDWPPAYSDTRYIAITTWGNHYYLVCRDIAFAEKYPTEEAAMRVAKRYAPPARISVKREAASFKEGD